MRERIEDLIKELKADIEEYKREAEVNSEKAVKTQLIVNELNMILAVKEE